MTPPALEAFLLRLSRLTNQEARQLAELPRVADWRVDAQFQRQSPIVRWLAAAAFPEYADAERSDQRSRALSAAIGDEGIADARARAGYILDQVRPTWPGMHLQRPLTFIAVGGVAVVPYVVVAVLSGREQTSDGLAVLIVALAAAFTALFAKFLLPPGGRDLRRVVEQTAVAHAARPYLSEDYFNELAGGWYAVLEGRWRRKRPWLAWGCLLAGLAVVVALFLLIPIAERALGLAVLGGLASPAS